MYIRISLIMIVKFKLYQLLEIESNMYVNLTWFRLRSLHHNALCKVRVLVHRPQVHLCDPGCDPDHRRRILLCACRKQVI